MEINLFTPHSGQEPIINEFVNSKHKFGVVSTPRQWGKSLLAENILLYWLLSNNNQKAGWISPIYSQCRKVFQEITDAAHDIILEKNKAELTVRFINGSTLQFLSAERGDSIRGFSFNYLVIDEAAFVKETVLKEAVLPTLTVAGKKCFIISTPKGKANWFFEYWIKGQQDHSNIISFKGNSIDNPYSDKDFIEEQRISLPTNIYRQEYMGEFVDSSADVFANLDIVCNLNRYENENKRERCFVGVDTGLQDDFSALCIMSESGRVLQMERINGRLITEIAERFISILSRYNIQGGYCETNGIGRAMFDLLRPKFRKIKGFTTTQDSKLKLVRATIEDIESGMLELPSKELEPQLYREMSLYTYKLGANGKMSFSHPVGEKDDMCDALMMCNYARNTQLISGGINVGQFKDNGLNIPKYNDFKPTFGSSKVGSVK